ncbi:hypothetical protein CK203_085540 [Vitis vinifera]|uniref:Uncharacterized protein n=1 Tax=Vitis vinifera TaxID=29760 RepID=A0A438C2H6_VITVI|nr:hypothetical protein CK203_085540 [Vitis vinifera]
MSVRGALLPPAQVVEDHFRISNVISILLVNDKPTPIEKLSHNATYFSKEQFNVGLRFPLPSLLKQFFHFTKIPPAFLHPNVVRVLMGCSVLDMLYHLDLSLLEIVFVYTIKMSQKERNLLAMVKKSKSFIIPILPCLAPQALVPDEHHVLKDLSCYEGPVIQPIQRPPNPPRASPAHSASTSASSYSVAGTEPEAKVKPVVSPIIYEEEE